MEINKKFILDILLFVKKHNGRVSRYLFDKYLISSYFFEVEESFNTIPRVLLEKEFIVLECVTSNIFIILTPLGSAEIE